MHIFEVIILSSISGPCMVMPMVSHLEAEILTANVTTSMFSILHTADERILYIGLIFDHELLLVLEEDMEENLLMSLSQEMLHC